MRRQIPPACAALGVGMTKGRRNRAVVRALTQRPRASRPHYIDKMPTYTRPSPIQFAVTSKSTVLEVIPPVWT